MRFRHSVAAVSAGVVVYLSSAAWAGLVATPANLVDAVYYNGSYTDAEPQDHLVPGTGTGPGNSPVYETGAIPIGPTGADFYQTVAADTPIHVGGNSITLKSLISAPYCLTLATPCTDQIDGFEFTFSSGVNIKGASIKPSSQFGYGSATVDVKSPTDLLLNLTGVYAAADQSITIDLTFPTVGPPPAPEPSTWVMMMIGFAGLGFAASRRTGAAPQIG